MTQKVGGVEFDVDVDVSGVTSASKTIQADLKNVETSFKRADSSANQLSGGSTKAGKSLSGLGKNAGQAGIQIQQFVGQIQGGQSALLALSQQGTDLGIVLGRAGLGAAVGIAATAFSFMIPTIRDTKSSLEKLDEIAEAVGKTFQTAADGSDVFSESIRRLADRSESLARVQIAQTISDLEGQISESANGIKDAADDIDGIKIGSGILDTITELGIQLEDVPRLFGDISNEVDSLGAGGVLAIRGVTERIDQLANQFGITREQALNLQIALDDFGSNKGAGGIASLRNAIENLKGEVGEGSEEFNRFAATLLPFFDATRAGVDRINLLRQALTDLDGEIKKNSEAGKEAASAVEDQNQTGQRRVESLTAQVTALQHGAEAAEIYAATQRAVADGTTAQLPEIVKLIQEKYRLRDAQLAAAETAKQEAQAQKNYESVLDQIIAKEEQRKRQKEADKEQAQQGLDAFRESLMTEQQLRAQAYLTELEQLKEAKDQKLITQAEYDALEKEKAQQHADELVAIEKERHNKEMQLEQQKRQAKLALVGDIFGNLASLMNTGSKKLFAIGKAAAVANAVVDGYAAVQKTMASVPYPFNVPLAAAQAVASAAQVKGIMSTKFGSAGSGQSYSGGQVVNNTSTQQAQQPEQRNISIALTGSGFSGGDIRGLISAINEELGDGVTLSATGG